jgi:hypothetical protein
MMLDKRVLRREERHVGHMSFLPQEVVRWDIWIEGLKRRHSSNRLSPRRQM